MNPQCYFNQLNEDYLNLHQAKEDLFWQTYMATSSDSSGFADAEAALNAFISDPNRIQVTRNQLQSLQENNNPDTDLVEGLSGWLAFFEANAIESESGRLMMSELIHAESALFAKRKDYLMYFENEQQIREQASLTVLSAAT